MHFLVLYYGRTQGIAPDGQAADDEPLSHADKARGVSCKVQSPEYTPFYHDLSLLASTFEP